MDGKFLIMYRVIIAGGRDFDDYYLLEDNVMEWILDTYLSGHYEDGKCIIEFISGKAKGADTLGEKFAKKHDYKITLFPADWNQYGKAAGPIRNRQMAEYAAQADKGVLFAFWDGESRGTKNMIDLAKQYGLDVHIINY